MADAKTQKTIPGLRIVARTEGFRRAGRAWSIAPQDVATSEFGKEQLAKLRAETMLIVVDIELPAASE